MFEIVLSATELRLDSPSCTRECAFLTRPSRRKTNPEMNGSGTKVNAASVGFREKRTMGIAIILKRASITIIVPLSKTRATDSASEFIAETVAPTSGGVSLVNAAFAIFARISELVPTPARGS
jgi:hypothetical protein